MNSELLSSELLAQLSNSTTCGDLFDCLNDLAFFIKNHRGEYMVVNTALVERCGRQGKNEIIGRRADQVYPAPMGDRDRAQDELVFSSGTPIRNHLELHCCASGRRGWCLTNKFPLRDRAGKVVGLVGTSKDLRVANARCGNYSQISRVVQYIQTHFGEPLLVNELAGMAGLSPYQLGKRIREIFKITVGQFIQKVRMENAMRFLQETDLPIAQIALECGYADQSAFTRQFRLVARVTPSACRSAVH